MRYDVSCITQSKSSMTQTNDEFKKSLSVSEDEILEFVPYLLQDLWELGGFPDAQLRLIESLGLANPRILDLGCGKGSSLIKILTQQNGTGLGVDLEIAFIEDAIARAGKLGLSERIQFKVENLLNTLSSNETFDIVLYGIDNDILGEAEATFRQLAQVVKPQGYVIVETLFPKDEEDADIFLPTQADFIKAVEQAGFHLVNLEVWDAAKLKSDNESNTRHIARRAQELATSYPLMTELFQRYVEEQVEECQEMETRFHCATVLCVVAQHF